MIAKIATTAIALFVLAFLIDGTSTHLLFEQDYGRMMKYELNPDVRASVEMYGTLPGLIIASINSLLPFFLVAIVGSAVVGIFFFNEFKTSYTTLERIVICAWLGTMVSSSFKIGAGILNLINYFV